LGPLRRLTLRQKLPLFLIGLTATALLVAGVVAWGEVRTAARSEAETRLRATGRQIADISRPGQETRVQLETEVGRSLAVRMALAGRPDSAALVDVLDTLDIANDGSIPIELWSAEGLVFRLGEPLPNDPDPEPPLEEERAWGPFHRVGESTYYWTSAPIDEDDGTPGWLAQRRRLGNAETAAAFEQLIGGGELHFVIGQEGGSWVDLAGVPEAGPPPGYPMDTIFVMEGEGGVPLTASVSRLDGTPWLLMVQLPVAAVNARPRAFILRILQVGIVLLLAVGLVGLVLSRQLTAPIEELASAADAIAAGGYGKVVRADGEDEMARLGRAFNAMSEQIALSDDQLRRRLDESRALTERLVEANISAEEAREEAQAASRAKSDFLATMSHEIRTPINAVIGYTELLAQGIPDPPTAGQVGYLQRIERSSKLLISLVNDVLDFARIESGQLAVRPGTGSAGEAIRAAHAALEPQAKLKGVELTSDCDDELFFQGDANRVQQILLNLLSNAVKFTGSGGSVRVTCALTHEGPTELPAGAAWIRADVEDTGIGVAADQLERVFEPFVQADTGFTREHGGVGLGLAISRRLADLLGGAITVRSVVGKGSRFTLWLRAAPAPAAAPAATS
jgi:signal transduction histidine kinase